MKLYLIYAKIDKNKISRFKLRERNVAKALQYIVSDYLGHYIEILQIDCKQANGEWRRINKYKEVYDLTHLKSAVEKMAVAR